MQENFGHYTVLLEETVDSLDVKPDGIYVDCTLGGAGHSNLIASKLTDGGRLIGIDRDEYAIGKAKERLAKYGDTVTFLHGNFVDAPKMLEEIGITEIDGVIADLGVSSFQLDNADRGFSYMQDAPLDMRMNQDKGFSAYNVINEYDERQLSKIISLGIPSSSHLKSSLIIRHPAILALFAARTPESPFEERISNPVLPLSCRLPPRSGLATIQRIFSFPVIEHISRAASLSIKSGR